MAHRQQVNAATRRQSLAIAYGETGHVAPYAADITDVRALICTTPRYRLVTNVGCEAIVSKRRSWVVCQANALSRSCKLAREFRRPLNRRQPTRSNRAGLEARIMRLPSNGIPIINALALHRSPGLFVCFFGWTCLRTRITIHVPSAYSVTAFGQT